MKTLQCNKYIEIVEASWQLRFRFEEKIYTTVSDTIRQASAQLEELDYTELYRAYSEGIRKSQVEPRVMFKLLVCAYLKGVYSSRKIEELCRENLQFIWLLDGQRVPDHCAIARFRSGKTTQRAIEGLFYQYAALLEKRGCTEHDEVFIDGTKLESKANRYTFVWKKTVERQLTLIRQKAKELLALEQGNLTRSKLGGEIQRLNAEISEQGISVQRGRGHRKPDIVRRRDELSALHLRWQEYERKRAVLGEDRNSFSKTDEDATFMHTKDDHMRNGQLKPCYNVQFAVNSGIITGIGVFSNRTDYATLIPLLKCMEKKHNAVYKRVVTDSGYESLTNYRWLWEHEQDAYIKPSNYASKRTKKYREQVGRVENMAYYKPDDCFLCKNGRHLDHYATYTETAKSGEQREVAHYRCEDCTDCPYRAACCKAKDVNQPKEVAVCWEFQKLREASLSRITTNEGKLLRVNRSIQAEGAFGQLKHNRSFKRFLTGGSCKVTSELHFLALSQNIARYLSKCNKGALDCHLCTPKTLLKF